MITRMLKHVLADFALKRRFSRAVLDAVEKAVSEQERRHSGQLRLAVEGGLPAANLLHGQGARARALEVFARLGVWDTQHNSGVLLYVLLGDRAVEIIADRGIQARVPQADWDAICRLMESHFARGEFARGSIAGIEAAGDLLAAHFPAAGERPNELPDQPAVL
jgi:TLP18.3/Psb32/MOLO-1 phosphatase superfamily protein